MVNWKETNIFERFENLSGQIPDVGNSVVGTFLDDGNFVSADKLGIAFKAKGIKEIRPVDSHVFVVELKRNKFEVWIKATNYTNLGELKLIAEKNNNSLIGATVKITRVALRDVNTASLKFERVSI